MKKNHSLIVLLLIIIMLSVFLFVAVIQNKKIRASLPYLTGGEKIKYFDIVGLDGEEKNTVELLNSPLSLIFIFNRSCSHCDGNILYWNRMVKLVENDNVNTYGVILPDHEEMFALKKKAKVKFDLYSPDDRFKFEKQFRIKIDLAQTILCQNNKVLMISLGELNGDKFNSFLTKIKSLSTEKEKSSKN